MDFKNAVANYIKHLVKAGRMQKSSLKAYQTDLAVFSEFLVERRTETHAATLFAGQEPVVDVTLIRKWDIDAFMQYASEERRNGPGAIRRKASSLTRFFRYLTRTAVIAFNPCDLEGLATPQKNTSNCLDEAPAIALLDHIRGKGNWAALRDYTMFRIILSMGLTVSEVTDLNREDFDGAASIDRFSSPAGPRIIPIPESVSDAVDVYLTALTASGAPLRNQRALFVSNRGARITARGVQYTLGKHVASFRREGPPLACRVSPQVLRNSFAVALLRNNADLEAVQSLLGHVAVGSTAVYARLARSPVSDTLSVNPFAKTRTSSC